MRQNFIIFAILWLWSPQAALSDVIQQCGYDIDDFAHLFNADYQCDASGVTRDGLRLTLQPKSGKAIHFTDIPSEGDGVQTYIFLGYLPAIHMWLVQASYYEGGEYILINADNGDVTRELPGPPRLSPDKKHFAVSEGASPENMGNRIQVWQKTATGLAKEYEVTWPPDTIGMLVTAVDWHGNDRLTVTFATPDVPNKPADTAELRFLQGHWQSNKQKTL